MSFGKTILLFLFFLSFETLPGRAFAGPVLDAFKKDVDALAAEQAKTPKDIIHYADRQGALARAVLNPERARRLVAECRAAGNGAEALNALITLYNPVALRYGRAFKLVPGAYDKEYLDSFELTYRLLIGTLNYLHTVEPRQFPENSRKMVESMQRVMEPLPPLLLAQMQQVIDAGRFSAAFRPRAEERLDLLKRYTESALPKTPPAATLSRQAVR